MGPSGRISFFDGPACTCSPGTQQHDGKRRWLRVHWTTWARSRTCGDRDFAILVPQSGHLWPGGGRWLLRGQDPDGGGVGSLPSVLIGASVRIGPLGDASVRGAVYQGRMRRGLLHGGLMVLQLPLSLLLPSLWAMRGAGSPRWDPPHSTPDRGLPPRTSVPAPNLHPGRGGRKHSMRTKQAKRVLVSARGRVLGVKADLDVRIVHSVGQLLPMSGFPLECSRTKEGQPGMRTGKGSGRAAANRPRQSQTPARQFTGHLN